MSSALPFGQRLSRAAMACVDAFAWPLRTSHYLELVNPLWSSHALQARVESVWDETADARSLTLRPGRNWRTHRPGQHIRVGVAIEGKQFTRTYSISSAPQSELITITVKAVPGGRMSHQLVRELKPGDYLPIGIPQGEFVLPEGAPVSPLFISAGSGITPIMSMLRSLVAEQRLPHVTHIHYAPHAHAVIFGNELRELSRAHPRYTLELVYTRDGGGQHFSGAQLEALCPDWREREVYACGPAGLLDTVEQHFAEAGLSKRLHTERFLAKLALSREVTRGSVRFTRSKVTAESDGVTNLLRLAEDAGLNPPHGCRMGICHGCDATLKSGCVRDLRTNDLLDEAGQTVQLCICAAAGDAELEL
jgi:stearoyl-CoA 9-desaturase NADPH oxidoreductase